MIHWSEKFDRTNGEEDGANGTKGYEVLAGIVSGSPIPPYMSAVHVQQYSSPYSMLNIKFWIILCCAIAIAVSPNTTFYSHNVLGVQPAAWGLISFSLSRKLKGPEVCETFKLILCSRMTVLIFAARQIY